MSKSGAQKYLHEYHRCVYHCQCMNRDAALILERFSRLSPPLAGKDRQAQDRGEHNLRKTRMRDRQPVMQ